MLTSFQLVAVHRSFIATATYTTFPNKHVTKCRRDLIFFIRISVSSQDFFAYKLDKDAAVENVVLEGKP